MKFESKCNHFRTWNWAGKCNLQNSGHFVSASMLSLKQKRCTPDNPVWCIARSILLLLAGISRLMSRSLTLLVPRESPNALPYCNCFYIREHERKSYDSTFFQYSDHIPAQWRLKSPSNWVFVQQSAQVNNNRKTWTIHIIGSFG